MHDSSISFDSETVTDGCMKKTMAYENGYNKKRRRAAWNFNRQCQISASMQLCRIVFITLFAGTTILQKYDTCYSEEIQNTDNVAVSVNSPSTILSGIYCHLVFGESEYAFTTESSDNIFGRDSRSQPGMAEIGNELEHDSLYCHPIFINHERFSSEQLFKIDWDVLSQSRELQHVNEFHAHNQIVRIDGIWLDYSAASIAIIENGTIEIEILTPEETDVILPEGFATFGGDGDPSARSRASSSEVFPKHTMDHFRTAEHPSNDDDFAPHLDPQEVKKKHDKGIERRWSDLPTTESPLESEEAPIFDSSISPLRGETRTMGILRVLIARVSGVDSAPSTSADDLARYTFIEEISLKDQMYRCSAGQLILLPANIGDVDTGVLEVPLFNTTITGKNRTVIVNEAMTALAGILRGVVGEETNEDYLDRNVIDKFADLVLLIVPPGSLPNAWAAYGVVNGRLTVYNDNWGAYVSTTMHEIGHNLGLYHAQSVSDHDEYGGQSGYMGAAMREYMYPQKCYNSQNHWQLGWFKDKAIEIDTTKLSSGPILLNIAAFVDYEKSQFGATNSLGQPFYILAKIHDVYYLQYNRAKDHNIGTSELGDKLVIVQHDTVSGRTDELVGLDSNTTSYEIALGGSSLTENKSLVFEICLTVNGNLASNDTAKQIDYMVVSIGYGGSICRSFLTNPLAYNTATSPISAPSPERADSAMIPPSNSPNQNLRPSNSALENTKELDGNATKSPMMQPNNEAFDDLSGKEVNGDNKQLRLRRNRATFVLFVVFQISFLLSLLGIYCLCVRHYKRQRALWQYKEGLELKKRLVSMTSNRHQDFRSVYNEPGDDSSSTNSFSSDSSETPFSIRATFRI